MQKLADIASVVISVGGFCQAHDLSEQDLAHLRDALQPLRRCFVLPCLPLFSDCLTQRKGTGIGKECALKVSKHQEHKEGHLARRISEQGHNLRWEVIDCASTFSGLPRAESCAFRRRFLVHQRHAENIVYSISLTAAHPSAKGTQH